MATSLGATEQPLNPSVAAPLATAAHTQLSLVPGIGAAVGRRLHSLSMSIFACLEVTAVALGVTIYTADPFGFVHRRLALVSVLGMAAVATAARVLPALRRRVPWTRSFEIVALFVYATLMTVSMGAANSPFIALYAITLLASAMLWDLWTVVALAVVTFGFTFLQTDYLDLMDEMPLFAIAVVLLNALLPAVVAATVIARVRRLFVEGKSGAV